MAGAGEGAAPFDIMAGGNIHSATDKLVINTGIEKKSGSGGVSGQMDAKTVNTMLGRGETFRDTA